MKKRMSRCAALIGTLLSLSSNAQVCNEVVLYEQGEVGKIESGGTFPEKPEWTANWGVMENLVPPYIRWSGVKNSSGDWKESVTFASMPTYVRGGSLSMDLRVTQNAKVGVWFEGDFGKSPVYYKDIDGNVSVSLKVPLDDYIGSGPHLVQKIGFGLFDVPAGQYTTLFVDNVSLDCGVSDSSEETEKTSFVFSDVVPSTPTRENWFRSVSASPMSSAYDDDRRKSLGDSTQLDFVMSEQEHSQIERFVSAEQLSAQESAEGWFKCFYFVERNRLRDSVIANPKTLFYEARAFVENDGEGASPLLVGNVDYGYRACIDSSCDSTGIDRARILVAGLPSASVRGSTLRLYYDPYFITTNRKAVPSLEIFSEGRWTAVPLKSHFDVNFQSAGLQKVQVRLSEGGVTNQQTLFVEVK